MHRQVSNARDLRRPDVHNDPSVVAVQDRLEMASSMSRETASQIGVRPSVDVDLPERGSDRTGRSWVVHGTIAIALVAAALYTMAPGTARQAADRASQPISASPNFPPPTSSVTAVLPAIRSDGALQHLPSRRQLASTRVRSPGRRSSPRRSRTCRLAPLSTQSCRAQ
jgi:hypothetical protein